MSHDSRLPVEQPTEQFDGHCAKWKAPFGRFSSVSANVFGYTLQTKLFALRIARLRGAVRWGSRQRSKPDSKLRRRFGQQEIQVRRESLLRWRGRDRPTRRLSDRRAGRPTRAARGVAARNSNRGWERERRERRAGW